ncbi:MAG: chromosomal replication initiator protein DnaA [Caldilineales bacterium]|nr:chromosomal replication initiator protein DnaA [Caldilineales bacterium]MDW8317077.1 chromosomal replication initiator protein DnaA [Anaerolineae bacterium]
MPKHSSLHHDLGNGASLNNPERAWLAALGELQMQVTADIYRMYLQPARFLAYEDGTFLIAVPNGFVKDWLEHRLHRVVKRTLEHMVGRAVELRFTVQPPAVRDANGAAPAPLLQPAEAVESRPAAQSAAEPSALVADYVFETFIVGPNNRIAHAAAMAVADQPGSRYNPLFIYSGVGLGKTHLLHAIGHRARQRGRRVIYVSGEAFTNELVTAIRTGAQEQFRAKYRTSEVLLVDDVQFVAGKPSTQEELFHTFNALHAAGRQIVLASDRPPKAIATVESRLRSRFEWGLIADIQPPSLEMRVAILQAKAKAQGAALPNGVLERIAALVPTNVRELEGALTRVIAYAGLAEAPLTPAGVDAILADMVPPKAQVSPEELLTLVARHFEVSVDDLVGSRRLKNVVLARQVAMYLLREDLNLPYTRIGEMFGGRDHATAMHSVRKVEELLDTDEVLRHAVDTLREQMAQPASVAVRRR